jgi:hypothetical protein
MLRDHDMILVTACCSHCGRTVAGALGEVRDTGVFGCRCGAMTRAGSLPLASPPMFGTQGWPDSGDAYPRST